MRSRELGMTFRSTSQEWMIISGDTVTLKGSGTVNGEEGYSFMIVAIDGRKSEPIGPDKIRIQIIGDGVAEFDNNDLQELRRGNIAIHRKRLLRSV